MLKAIKQAILDAEHIVFFTGYGVSQASHVPNIRSVENTYSFHTYAEIMSHDCLQNQTDLFFSFYRNVVLHQEYHPNQVHTLIARLQRKKSVTVITENIDGLHRKAGSIHTIELFGSLDKNECTNCFEQYPAAAILYAASIPLCRCGGVIRPSIILCNEAIQGNTFLEAASALQHADLLILCGTDMQLHPIPYLLSFYHGDKTIAINDDAYAQHLQGSLSINGDPETIFHEIYDCLK